MTEEGGPRASEVVSRVESAVLRAASVTLRLNRKEPAPPRPPHPGRRGHRRHE